MKPFPKISIVTPTYNQGAYIEETILSVLEQNYPNLEYIIIDGGSTDNTIEIIKKYQRHLKYWVSEPDRGQSEAINKGLKQCTGEIFNWLNSDDILVLGSLEKIADEFIKHDCDVVSGEEIIFYENGEEIKKIGSLVYPSLEETIYRGIIYQPSTYWRLETLKEFLPVKEQLHYLMDADLWVRYLLKYGQKNILKLSTTLIRFRMHKKSKTVSEQSEFIKQRWAIRRALFSQISKLNQLNELLTNEVNDLIDYSEVRIYQRLDPHKLKILAIIDLVELKYIQYDYKSCKQLINELSLPQICSNLRLINYWVRLFLLPNFFLNVVRKSNSKTIYSFIGI